MKKTRAQSINNVRNSINAISGDYTVKLIDKLYDENCKQQDMQDLYFAIAALFDTNRIPEAMHLIRGLFAIAKMNYPYPIAALEPFDVAQEAFVAEFIMDFYEIIEEKQISESQEANESG
ncbi:MAG: hypothetical protein PHX08_09220 [Lachnospiraceae bacterium]|nr:hypothetical protein [Lachnospiraceae bacterium]